MDAIITSANNPTVKHIRKLLTSNKARRDERQYVAEGIHLVRSFLDTGKSPALYAVAASAIENPEVAGLEGTLGNMNASRVVLADSLFSSLTSIHAQVGILIVFSPDEIAADRIPKIATDSVLALEDIQDPGNMGTILRTAAAVGIQRVLLSPGCASPWSPKALRAGMGAQFSVSIYEETDLFRALQNSTLPVLATVLEPDAASLYDTDLTKPVVWLFGNEGQGISEQLARCATQHIYIPQAATAVESLNVSAAAAICLYEQYRQNI